MLDGGEKSDLHRVYFTYKELPSTLFYLLYCTSNQGTQANYRDPSNRIVFHRPFLATLRSVTYVAVPITRGSSSTRVLQGMAINVRFRLTVFKEGAGDILLRLAITLCIQAHCSLNTEDLQLCRPPGSDLRHLSDKITPLCITGVAHSARLCYGLDGIRIKTSGAMSLFVSAYKPFVRSTQSVSRGKAA
jgi:hypothetical protein